MLPRLITRSIDLADRKRIRDAAAESGVRLLAPVSRPAVLAPPTPAGASNTPETDVEQSRTLE